MNDHSRLTMTILGFNAVIHSDAGTSFYAVMAELARKGHEIIFLEPNSPLEAADINKPYSFGNTHWYHDNDELQAHHTTDIANADAVIVCSLTHDSAATSRLVTSTARGVSVFYDINSSDTLDDLEREDGRIIDRATIPLYDLYLSFSGGRALHVLKNTYGATHAYPLYYSVNPQYPSFYETEPVYDMGYYGHYSDSRFYTLNNLLIEPAKCWKNGRFVVSGNDYPDWIEWPGNIDLTDAVHRQNKGRFYNSLRYYLNITREDTIRTGYSPQHELFDAASCGTAVISEFWEGLDAFFRPGDELLIARSTADVLKYLRDVQESKRLTIGSRASERISSQHTATHRASELENHITSLMREKGVPSHVSIRHHSNST